MITSGKASGIKLGPKTLSRSFKTVGLLWQPPNAVIQKKKNNIINPFELMSTSIKTGVSKISTLAF